MHLRHLDWAPLLAPTPPWAHLICCDETEIDGAVSEFQRGNSGEQRVLVRIIHAQRCPTWWLTYTWWAAVLQFPGYFGYNGAAFDDCITDLSWLRSDRYVIVITRAYMLLRDENEHALAAFLEQLKEASLFWNTPVRNPRAPEEIREQHDHEVTPFHILFHCEADLEHYTRDIYARAGIALPSVTFLEP
ncbi:MAG: barstar family protein [Thermomicrobiales bacterium]